MTKGSVKLTPENCPHDQGWNYTFNSISKVHIFVCARGCGSWSTVDVDGKTSAEYKNRENEPGKHFVPLSKDGKL